MDFDHVHFQVDNVEYWRKWFADTLKFQFQNALSSESGRSSTVEMTTRGGVKIRLSSLPSSNSLALPRKTQSNKRPNLRATRCPGVKDVAFRVARLNQAIAQVLDAGGTLVHPVRSLSTSSGTQNQATVLGWGGLHHTLIESDDFSSTDTSPEQMTRTQALSQAKLQQEVLFSELECSDLKYSTRSYASSAVEPHSRTKTTAPSSTLLRPQHQEIPTAQTPLISAIDHVVLNVPVGEIEPAVAWYEKAFGMERQQRFSIQTNRSALHSQVLKHPEGNVQFPINEPASPHSQIQEFLDAYGGAGIQHIALRTENILEAIAHMRDQGVLFLDVPPTYYEQIQKRNEFSSGLENFEAIARLKILVDWPTHNPDALLLQTFTQPLFGQPTFFFEVIQRQLYDTPQGQQHVQGFGEGNFQALFEAVEREQMRRGQL